LALSSSFSRSSINFSRQGIGFLKIKFIDRFEYYHKSIPVKKQIETTSNSRREFTRKVTAGIAGASLLSTDSFAETAAPTPAKPKKNLLHHVGADYHVVMADPFVGLG
jgi:hypothetical protein